MSFAPLPGAEREANFLKSEAKGLGFSKAAVWTGRDASKAQLNQVRSPEVLHLATHSFMLPEITTGQTAAGRGINGTIIAAERVSPMLRCGLVLAGAQRTLNAWSRGDFVAATNDGIFTAEEIAAMDLRHTRLAVLSSCDSGGGVARAGEGVFGLRRGFIQAGAENLVLTLWPVDDEKTAEFMVDFYRTARQLDSYLQALPEAQRLWLRQLRERSGIAEAVRLAGAFIISFQGRLTALDRTAAQD
jgi:CHAT domain-containing protein